MAPSSGISPAKQQLNVNLAGQDITPRSLIPGKAPDNGKEQSLSLPQQAAPTSPGGSHIPHFFLAANNYLGERHHAQERFRLLQEVVVTRADKETERRKQSVADKENQNIQSNNANNANNPNEPSDQSRSGSKSSTVPPALALWTNDDVEMLGEDHMILPFKPTDSSFESYTRQTERWAVPSDLGPGYRAKDLISSSTWQRLSAQHPGAMLFPVGDELHSGRVYQGRFFLVGDELHSGRVYQGSLTNSYFIHALTALSLRPKLLRDVFAGSDLEQGMHSLMFYKNGQYVAVEVDDLVPFTKDGKPVCCIHEQHPQIIWPGLLEKGYAKLHCQGREGVGWDVLGGGGSVEECLVDMTGGVGGRWYCCDISPDRIFVYLRELQREALFCCDINTRNCAKRGVYLTPHFPYTVNRAVDFEGSSYVQLHCGAPSLLDGQLSESAPWGLVKEYESMGETRQSGFFFLSILDFCEYIETVHEVRLVNSGANGAIKGMPQPRLPFAIAPPFVREPMFEVILACDGVITYPTRPEFIISVLGEGPCEVLVSVSQTDERLKAKSAGQRSEYVPIELRAYEQVQNNYFTLVTKSSWIQNARDSTLCFKAPGAGTYLLTTEFLNNASDIGDMPANQQQQLSGIQGTSASSSPSRGGRTSTNQILYPGVDPDADPQIHRLILRAYSTRKIFVSPPSQKKIHKVLIPSGPRYPRAIRWSMVGSRNPEFLLRPDLPEEADGNEGVGTPAGWRKSAAELAELARSRNEGEGACVVM